jgi:hypothetical protein
MHCAFTTLQTYDCSGRVVAESGRRSPAEPG